MNVEISSDPKLRNVDHLFVVLAEGKTPKLSLPQPARGAVEKLIADSGFQGRSDESITLTSSEPKKVTLIGIGKESALNTRGARTAIYGIAKAARRSRDKTIAVAFPYLLPELDAAATTRRLADYLAAADYKYGVYITVKKEERVPGPMDATLIASTDLDKKTARRLSDEARAIADGLRTIRNLGNAPGNLVTPTRLAERAEEVAKETGIRCTVHGKREIERMKMGGLLAVNRGSAEEPRFVVLEYTPRKSKKHVALVGKGITFDSGGISIKPAERMEEMKFDMSGAAAVIGIMETVAKLELPVKVTGCFPSTENLPGGRAYKPGDIITMMSGKTVEIVNTDAEGRMILGDALHWASQKKPDHLLDYATLTGACVIALGGEASGLFSNDDELAQKLITCGERSGERLWRLPEWEQYRDLIRSEWADMKNSGGRWGGAITAAVFLKEFVDCPSWAHFDIAGTAYTEHETAREIRGATGAGLRVTVEFLESLSA